MGLFITPRDEQMIYHPPGKISEEECIRLCSESRELENFYKSIFNILEKSKYRYKDAICATLHNLRCGIEDEQKKRAHYIDQVEYRFARPSKCQEEINKMYKEIRDNYFQRVISWHNEANTAC